MNLYCNVPMLIRIDLFMDDDLFDEPVQRLPVQFRDVCILPDLFRPRLRILIDLRLIL